MNEQLFKEELEDLTGKIYKGDFTPLLFDLVKDSPNIKSLIKELHGTIIEEQNTTVMPKASISFDELFADGLRIR